MSALADLYRRDLTRLIQELEATPAELLWETRPGVTNSIGNLALHLEGNLRHYIGHTLGGVTYTRQRPLEFSTKNVPAPDFRPLVDLIPRTIAALTPEALAAQYPEIVLGKPLSTEAFLIHLYGHLNWHLGQIDYFRRILTGNPALDLAGL